MGSRQGQQIPFLPERDPPEAPVLPGIGAEKHIILIDIQGLFGRNGAIQVQDDLGVGGGEGRQAGGNRPIRPAQAHGEPSPHPPGIGA